MVSNSEKDDIPFSDEAVVNNEELKEQNLDENFIELKKQFIFFQDKSNLTEIQENLGEEKFLMISKDMDADQIKDSGIDFFILADVSESIYPYRIFLKKCLYFTLMDLENYVYGVEDINSDYFKKVRIAIIKYTDNNSKNPVAVSEFVEYNKFGDVLNEIDNICIEKESNQKRAVFDGMKAITSLAWNPNSFKIVVHIASEPGYGNAFTMKTEVTNYDPFPDYCDDNDVEEIIKQIDELKTKYTLVKLGGRLEKFSKFLKGKMELDISKPVVKEIN